ncbi:F-box protein CPR1-like [Mercurialis annua]|uniref:F-box protein CPR1-like n=1 Tax=Mercurialis annua TaxID=3986 RepID=UPI002160CF27|nr:F-box protein CPR1-like [Mercurialis annua]
MSDQIPLEIVSKIISRCEAAALGRCRCVSKQWRALIGSPHFIKQHLEYATRANFSSVFFKQQSSLVQASMDSTATFSVPITDEVKPFFIVGTCSGLLLLRKNQTHDFCILNPTTNQHVYLKKLLPSDFLSQATAVFLGFGFGYDSGKDDYKVIRIAQEFNPATMGYLRTEMVISSVKKKALKFVKMPYFIQTTLGFFSDGALHWLMGKYNHENLRLIVGYDLATGEFRELPLPDFRKDAEDFKCKGNVTVDCSMGVGQLGKWISLCANYGESMGVSIWAMKEYGVKESWTKLFSISLAKLPSAIIKPLGLMENGNLVLLELNNAPLVWYDRKEKKVRTLMQNKSGEAMICLTTIAPVPSTKNGKKGDKNSSSGNPKKTARKKNRDDFLSKGFKIKL